MDAMCHFYYGFASDKSELQRSNIYARLNAVRRNGRSYSFVNYEGKAYSFTEYIRQLVKEADAFSVIERNGKKEYRAEFPSHMVVPLNKTQYEFALYLKEHGFQDDAAADAAYEEWKRATAAECERAKAEEQALAEQRNQYKTMKKALDDKLENLFPETEKRHPCAVAVAQNMSAKNGYAYSARLLRVLALMDHSEIASESDVAKTIYEKAIRESLYTGNKVSRKLFQLYSGMNLPNTESGTTETLTEWLRAPTVLSEEAVLESMKKTRVRRSSDTVAMLRILSENDGQNALKPALIKGHDKDWLLFNAQRLFIIPDPEPSIPTYEDEAMAKSAYRIVDSYFSNLHEPIDQRWSMKTLKEFMKEHPKDNCPVEGSNLWVNPLFLVEAFTILGDNEDTLFYPCKTMIAVRSQRGIGLICMSRGPHYDRN